VQRLDVGRQGHFSAAMNFATPAAADKRLPTRPPSTHPSTCSLPDPRRDRAAGEGVQPDARRHQAPGGGGGAHDEGRGGGGARQVNGRASASGLSGVRF